MNSVEIELLHRAGECYERAEIPGEAARCYREAGSFRRAAELFERVERFHDAAVDYARGGMHEHAAWLLVHEVGEPGAARDRLASAPPLGAGATVDTTAPLRKRLVAARCDVAEARPLRQALAALADVRAELIGNSELTDAYVEPWAIAIAEAMGREDQAALVHAAAVRGERLGAEERWAAWSQRVLGAPLVLPTGPRADLEEVA